MLKKLMLGLGAVALTGALSVSTALAQAPTAKQSLVALGDSITYGYNLNSNILGDVNNHHTSRDAFPYLMGSYENMRVRDLGVSGWTSQDLLKALTSNEEYRQAVRHANVVTIDIGSNDLLHILLTEGLDVQALEEAGYNLDTVTLPAILTEVHKLNPTARVVVYNIYNPIPSLNAAASLLLGPINDGISVDAARFGATYADAYSIFEANQNTYVLSGGVHPTAAGQEALAGIGEQALATP